MKLNSYYKKSMRKIDKNYERIVKTYGGALQYLVEKDQESSSIEFSVEECKSKIEDIQNDLSDLKYAIEYIDEQIRSNYIDLCNGINERLSNIDTKPVRNPEREKPKWEDTITNRMLHWSYTPEQKEEVKKALAAGVPKATILTYFYAEVTVEKMSSYRNKH